MTVQEALQNVDIVIANARMDRKEHGALAQSIQLIAKRCEIADKLEAAAQGAKDGTTDKPVKLPRTDKKDS